MRNNTGNAKILQRGPTPQDFDGKNAIGRSAMRKLSKKKGDKPTQSMKFNLRTAEYRKGKVEPHHLKQTCTG